MKYWLTVLVALYLFAGSTSAQMTVVHQTEYQWIYPEGYFPLENSDPTQKWVLKDGSGTNRFNLAEYNALPANHGDAHVCLYENDKEACFTLTCDVSYHTDEDWWIKVQNEIGVQVTHFVVTDRINHYWSSRWTNWAGVRKVYAAGIALGSHSSTHSSTPLHESGAINFVYDYKVAKEVLEDSIPGFTCHTIAHPGGGFGNDSDSIAMFYNGRRGTAGGVNRANKTDWNNTASSSSWKQSNFDAMLNPANQNWRGYYSIMKHGMVDTTARAEHEVYFNYIKSHEDRVWLASYPDIMRYGQERDTHTLTVNSVTDEIIKFTVTDSMHDTIFTYPLTVKVRVNNDWGGVSARQGNNDMDAEIVENGGNKYALVKAVPDQGEVTLTKGSVGITVYENRALTHTKLTGQKAVYNMQGQRVVNPQQNGMYVLVDENGKTIKMMFSE